MPEDTGVVDDLGLSPAALATVAERYLRRDAEGRICESPGRMMDRVARFVAGAEDAYRAGSSEYWARRFAALLRSREFLPNSPTLMNAGTGDGVLSGCFVLPLDDSLDSIFTTLRTAALLHREGAGTGFAFSHLRPRGSRISTGGSASGPVSFIELFDAAARVIRLGGRRRAANMAVLHVRHPDIREFVHAKTDTTVLSTFNLSVAVTDEFMRAAAEDRGHRLIDPHTGATVQEVSARGLLADIAEQAWRTGEPGVLFLDAVARADPLPDLGPLEATNPCGEVPLLPYESCNLGSICLPRLLDGDHIDEQRLARVVRGGVRFLDDVIDVAEYPVPELGAAARATRKIGLGIMGLAETLAALGLPYDSVEAVGFTDRLMSRIARWARTASRELAAERGAFPLFARSIPARQNAPPVRNAQVTSIAPTGTISLIAGVSAGIEPLFALAYTRHLIGRQFDCVEPLFEQAAIERGVWSEAVAAEVAATGIAGANLPADLRRLFRTAQQIAPIWHVRMQTAVQRHTDAAVAKTVNMAPDSSVADVEAVFTRAWRAGNKGVTVYRSGSRPDQVLRYPDASTDTTSNDAAVVVRGAYGGGTAVPERSA
ncbi:adenosylcobalamin-dependent ribonucleoside-diphosphate reductase [Nocardia nova]|uniref:adenosylcobalamin-dependent ribonucleoside-diphosphate reductase n=1 Tax=Nocardia nova TaxID=37330 RepID=UPI00273A4953|nr:adenosylcobalamin-dependent ribonucleoside-diphosphate reductase [Nocardia nova]